MRRWRLIMTKKGIVILGWVLTIASIVMLYGQGVTRSFFHQDDVVELAVAADWRGWSTIFHLNNEHLNISFWPLLRSEWLLFGINYTPYLIFNVLLHMAVLALIFLITYRLTRSWLWSSLPVWGMVIDANWYTVVWWITGQMFFLSTIFALLSFWLILEIEEKKEKRYRYLLLYLFSIMPAMSWGVGLTWPLWPLIIYGIEWRRKRLNKIGLTMLAAQSSLAVLYFSVVGKNLAIHTDPKTWLANPLGIAYFALVGFANTLVGRFVWPVENLKLRLICLVALLLILVSMKPFKFIKDRGVMLGLLVAVGSFVTIALPRWRFGIGQAMASYYSYFPLAFILICIAVLLSRMKLKGWKEMLVISVFLLHIPMSWIGFEDWAREWVVRPQQTRAYFQELNSVTLGKCIPNRFIPTYIVPQEIWHIDFIWPVFKKEFDPFCDSVKK